MKYKVIKMKKGKLKERREELGLSQQQLARFPGCDHSYLSLIENGKRVPRYPWLKVVADALMVEVDALADVKEMD